MSDLPGQRRRSLYTYLKRTNPFPNRITFDGTDRTYCDIPPNPNQYAFAGLNLAERPAYLEAAGALAKEMISRENTDEETKIRWGYQKIMLREPSPEKIQVLSGLLQEALKSYENDQEAAFTLVANTLLNLDEFINK